MKHAITYTVKRTKEASIKHKKPDCQKQHEHVLAFGFDLRRFQIHVVLFSIMRFWICARMVLIILWVFNFIGIYSRGL